MIQTRQYSFDEHRLYLIPAATILRCECPVRSSTLSLCSLLRKGRQLPMTPVAYLRRASLFSMFYHTVGAARLVNVTVDDQDLRIQYAPEEKHWMSLVGQDCDNGCNTSPDPAQVFNHTWHDATYNFKGSGMSAPQTFAFQFNGTYAKQ